MKKPAYRIETATAMSRYVTLAGIALLSFSSCFPLSRRAGSFRT
jgi:hypothetical protein